MSQEYNKVVWQDETTSQQGTLINAERLDQMQTAHHYADGFEEVDTAPTADPGVDYHKVVYCTADSTFYRWDGTQWQKDIDDDTKALLLAHEADHANPHVVTKAQVGLGNCDNTSDLDKPISTAMATALATKADNDKVVHNTGNEDVLGVKKHYSQILRSAGTLGEVFNYTVLGGTASGGEKMWELKGESRADGTASILLNSRKSDGTYETIVLGDGQGSSSNKVVTAGEMSTALADKVDKLGSSPAGTYQSVTVNAQGQVTAGTNPTTLAGYGITDAYTKSEADTLLGAKADQATTYTKSEVQTYVSNALDGYLPMVRTTGNQTINGVKTFINANTTLLQQKDRNIITGWSADYVKAYETSFDTSNVPRAYYRLLLSAVERAPTLISHSSIVAIGVSNESPRSATVKLIGNAGGMTAGEIVVTGELNGTTYTWTVWKKGIGGGNAGVGFKVLAEYASNSQESRWAVATDDARYAITPSGYNDSGGVAHTFEIYAECSDPVAEGYVTLATAQTISGAKTFTENITIQNATDKLIQFNDGNGTAVSKITSTITGIIQFEPGLKTGGVNSVKILNQRAYTSTNPTADVATIGTLDAYTPMVRTTGNQTVAGAKTFTSQDVHENGVMVKRSFDAFIHRETTNSIANGGAWSRRILLYQDADGVNCCYLQGGVLADGRGSLTLYVRNSDGSYKSEQLAIGDII